MDQTAEAAVPVRRRPHWLLRFIVGSNPAFTVARALVWVLVIFLTFKFFVMGIRVTGHSMEPNFRHGEVKFVNRLAYKRHPPQRGDVVAVASPEVKNVLLLKRVMGVPGETISIRGGRIFVNDKPMDEPYAKGKIPWKFRNDRTLQSREYFVIGDNRDISELFLVYENQIVGRVIGSK